MSNRCVYSTGTITARMAETARRGIARVAAAPLQTTPLVMCCDCALIITNGCDPDDADQREHVLRMVAHTSDWHGTLVVENDLDEFSAVRCDTCGTDLAGFRFAGCLIATGVTR